MKKILVGVVAAVMSASVFAAPDKATQAKIDALEKRIVQLEKRIAEDTFKMRLDTVVAIQMAANSVTQKEKIEKIFNKPEGKVELTIIATEFVDCTLKILNDNSVKRPIAKVFEEGSCYTKTLWLFDGFSGKTK